MRKPDWLNKKVSLAACNKVKGLLRELDLHTVCEESLCPNVSECFSGSAAAFMILGDVCTRSCRFCNVKKGNPSGVDYTEPLRVKEAVKRLSLKYVVITSPCRDDLEDGGSKMFVETVKEIKKLNRNIKVEILIPDFGGDKILLEKTAYCGADVIAHNLETVPSLYIKVRSYADYDRSLKVLRVVKEINKNIFTKSGVMLGLGESSIELIEVLKDLRKVNCDFLTLGQYLAPSLKHYSVKRYIPKEEFLYLSDHAYKSGFKQVMSSPYTRSSYLAHSFFIKNML